MSELHTFHIPVLGLGYSIDTPVKVAQFGISSVMSIMDDELLELMREHHCRNNGIIYKPIEKQEHDARARRITAYLDVIHDIVTLQIARLKEQSFGENSELDKYFELLPEDSALKQKYRQLPQIHDQAHRLRIEEELRNAVTPGSIDVNIMAKVDKLNHDKSGQPLAQEFSDALAALRGFANSKLTSSVIISAGYNPRLYAYLEQFKDFFPNEEGKLRKKVILKVSDYRSALVQGKILAKKGIWVSEFRIESGLNCGGHAFATDGLLLGPILEEFKINRNSLTAELYELCLQSQHNKGIAAFTECPGLKITVQGGIGTAEEQEFLIKHYHLDRTGWGSPFLLVPEATSVDEQTIGQLATAEKDDYYLSHASPLGVPFNNFRKSTAERQRQERIDKGRPGSPCYKKMLVSNTEFTAEPICTASRLYQHLKIKQLKEQDLPDEQYNTEYNKIIEKDCLCEGLTAPALLKEEIPVPHNLNAVTICPGPNLAYFSGIFSLTEMVGHIYGRKNILNTLPRPHMFVNELQLYITYLKDAASEINLNAKRSKYLNSFKANLQEGITYYQKLAQQFIQSMQNDLCIAEKELQAVLIPVANN
ncbi:MAG: hypothetical protein H3C54_00275 [Taibaiella sp.]|nr:hypothetical protein [Taibaiella sp.]